MNFDFSEDQKALGAQVRRALERASPLTETRRVVVEGELHSKAAWAALADLGVLGAPIAETYGGVGLGPLEVCVAAYELGFALAATPFVSSCQCIAALTHWGAEADKAKWLPAFAAGSLIGCAALIENGVALEAGPISVTVRNGRLHGVKHAVLDGASADVAVVLAMSGGKPALAIADLRGEGVSRRAHECIDPARPSADLAFDGAPCVVLKGADLESAQRVLDFGAIVMAFEQIGAAERAMFMARDYALSRKAFGQTIGAYQAIKHKIADMYVKIETARVHAYWGAWAASTDAVELPLAAAGARAMAIEALSFAAKENVQVHGGIGFTWESDCHLFYKRSRAYALALGPAHRWRERITQQLVRSNLG